MCGILGSINLPFSEETLQRIAHRGPDAYGLETLHVADDEVTLGHRRLSIVDLSPAGAQPMGSPCGQYRLLFNGEIYNHAELRRKLPEVQFRGHSDTETVLHYLIRFGIRAVADFNGIFALSFVDVQRRKLYLVRDRFGVKPLYYHQAGNRLIFSSELRPILDKVPATLNREALAVLLRLRYNPAPDTLYAGISKLRPGHIGIYDFLTTQFKRFPFVERKVNSLSSITFDDAVSEYGRLVEAAVKRQLMADVEVGVLLSGGIDSAIIAHFAAKHYPEKIKAFTVGYTQRSDQDEVEHASYTARRLGVNHIITRVSEENFRTVLPKTVSIIEEPSATISAIPMYYLCQSVAPHLKVVLTGQGADEPLGGYFRYQSELLYGKLPFPAQAAALLSKFPLLRERETARRALLAWQEKDPVKRFDESYALFTTDEIYRLTGISKVRSQEYIRYYFDLMEGRDRHPVEAMMRNDLHMNLSDDLLNYTDKLSMNFGIEARVPFLDNELVDFADSLPHRFRLRLGKTKIIHKAFAASILDKTIIHRKKLGFGSPAREWLKGESGRAYAHSMTGTDSPFSEHFNAGAVNKLFRDHQEKGYNREKQLFTLMSVYSWMNDHFGVTTGEQNILHPA